MSRNNNNNVSEKKYCKVCQDAGKSEAEFRSHFTRESRDPNSNVTCPLLLALECRYCYKNGHTVKYCPVIKEKEKQNKREESSYRFYETSKKVSNPIDKQKQAPRNAFTCLNCESDDEDNNVKNNNTKNNTLNLEFPELVQAKNTAYNNNNSNNYAAALATAVPEPKVVKPILIPVPVPVSLPKINYISKTTVPILIPVPTPTINVAFPSNIKKMSTISWADMESDSSDDDEEEYINSSPVNSKITMVNGYDSDW